VDSWDVQQGGQGVKLVVPLVPAIHRRWTSWEHLWFTPYGGTTGVKLSSFPVPTFVQLSTWSTEGVASFAGIRWTSFTPYGGTTPSLPTLFVPACPRSGELFTPVGGTTLLTNSLCPSFAGNTSPLSTFPPSVDQVEVEGTAVVPALLYPLWGYKHRF
jgi:hypothetical protein